MVLDERKEVLALSEQLDQYDGRRPYVEVQLEENVYERRDVEVGLSDGLVTEVLSGVSESDLIKVWNQPATNDLSGRTAAHRVAGHRGQGVCQDTVRNPAWVDELIHAWLPIDGGTVPRKASWVLAHAALGDPAVVKGKAVDILDAGGRIPRPERAP